MGKDPPMSPLQCAGCSGVTPSRLSCPPRTSPTGQAPGEVGRSPRREPSLLHTARCALGHVASPPPVPALARGRGWGFLCARGTLSPGWWQPPPKEGHFWLQRLHFWVTPHGAFTCVLDRGKMLAAPPGTWSRPPGHAADGLPAPLRSWSSPQAPLRLPVTPASTEVSAQVWLSPSPGGSSAGLPPASSAPSAGKKHHLRAEEGVRGETQCHVPPGDGWRAQGQLVQPLCHPGASSRQRG